MSVVQHNYLHTREASTKSNRLSVMRSMILWNKMSHSKAKQNKWICTNDGTNCMMPVKYQHITSRTTSMHSLVPGDIDSSSSCSLMGQSSSTFLSASEKMPPASISQPTEGFQLWPVVLVHKTTDYTNLLERPEPVLPKRVLCRM